MGFSTSTQNRNNLQDTIRSKQQLYNRFNRRFNTSKSPNERMFIKAEMNRLSKDLTQCASQWRSCGFGSNSWVTRNYGAKTSTSSSKSNSYGSRSTRSSSTSKSSNSHRKTKRSNSKSNKRSTGSTSKNNNWSWGRSFSFSR